ncbi:phage Gp37/Gp68 family protein [Streptomyces xanthochromogenes]|uniref:DUF5131 family protein n=1 Tax=Streptomyces xanthochromogenes TaxID=67384 RepID=UPI0034453F97
MADATTIEWTNRTWNPVTGCTKISDGCTNCYAETIAERFRGHAAFPNGFDVQIRTDKVNAPLTWRKPARVFVNSMSDLFHDQVDQSWIADIFAVMAAARRHTFQLLTKRHARMRHLLNDAAWIDQVRSRALDKGLPAADWAWPIPNLWLGVSVESQQWANIRIPALLGTPAAVRFLSCEPLLGPVDLTRLAAASKQQPGMVYDALGQRYGVPDRWQAPTTAGIDWVIVGGESGRNARAMHPDWARSLRDQCIAADVPFFFKQWGEWGPAPFIVRVCDPDIGWQGTDEELAAAKADSEARGATHVHTGNWVDEENGERTYWLHEIGHKPWSLERCALPEGAAPIRRWGKKRAGRVLDSRAWDQFPEPR